MIDRMEYWIKELEEENPLLSSDIKHWRDVISRIKYVLESQ